MLSFEYHPVANRQPRGGRACSPAHILKAETLELALHAPAPPLIPVRGISCLFTRLPQREHSMQGMQNTLEECTGALCCRPDCSVFATLQVKAERHVDGEATIEDLQHRTVKHIKEEHHEEEEVYPDPSKAGKKSQ